MHSFAPFESNLKTSLHRSLISIFSLKIAEIFADLKEECRQEEHAS
jgi:hypothetical protein